MGFLILMVRKSKEDYLKELKIIAESKGGEIISSEYTNSKVEYQFKCKNGHKFWRYPPDIKKNRWCNTCIKKIYLKAVQKIAKERNGKLISTEYNNAHTPLLWKCNICKHVWPATTADIKGTKKRKGTWCPKCAGKLKYTIEDMLKFAKAKGGKCLSTRYTNVKTHLIWKCGECGFEWSAMPDSVINQGTWCPKCAKGISERICRKFFETIFNTKFPIEKKFTWLINNDGNQMHLDGYNKKLSLAFEYNGIQHYQYKSYFYKNKEEFEKRTRDDKRKKKLCKENGIILIIIPYWIDFEKMEVFIIKECKKRGIHVTESERKIDWREFGIQPSNKIREMHELAEIKSGGGKCLSPEYLGAHIELRWQCGICNNIWWATPNNVKNHSTWCPKCAGKEKTIEDMHQLAAEKLYGGQCLSHEYLGAHTHLTWKCGICRFEWSATPNNIQQGKNCPNCWRQRNLKLLEKARMNNLKKIMNNKKI